MSEFPSVVEEYINKRNTFPVCIMYQNESMSEELFIQLENDIQDVDSELVGVDVLAVERCSGEYWSGLFIEFSGKEVPNVTNEGEYDPHTKTLLSHLRSIYRQYRSDDVRRLHTGDSVPQISSVEDLGKEYFNI